MRWLLNSGYIAAMLDSANSSPLAPARIAALVAGLSLVLLAWVARVDNSFGDNHLSLLTSQALIEQGSPRLDTYVDRCGQDSIISRGYGSYLIYNKHYYYYFPIGTPLLSLPLVGAAKLSGADMVRAADVQFWRRIYTAISLVILFSILRLMCRRYVSDMAAVMWSLMTVLGTTAASTIGTGNWSHNAATILIATLLYWTASRLRCGKFPVRAGWIGIVVVMAYLCRPSTVVWSMPILAYCCWLEPRRMRWAILGLLLFAGAFVCWSHLEYGRFLPPYYAPERLTPDGKFSDAFWGNWISPARGILCFSPLICLGLLTVWLPGLRRQGLTWLLVLGFVAQWLIISRFPHWWGGWSFGPRLQTESVPGLALLTLIGGVAVFQFISARWARRLVRVFVGLLAAWGILVHTYQGMFRPEVMGWNGTIDTVPAHYIWEWRYPQFLAAFQPAAITTHRSNYRLRLSHQLRDVPTGSQLYCAGDVADFPMLRKVCREFNADQTLGDVFLFPDFHLRVADRPLYATLGGRKQLAKDHPDMKAIPLRPYADLGTALRAREEGITYVLANALVPDSLSPTTCSYLSRAGAEIPCGAARYSLMLKLHHGKLVWGEWSADKQLRKQEYLGDKLVNMIVDPGKPHWNPYFQFGGHPYTDYTASAYVIHVTDNHDVQLLPMELQDADAELAAAFKIE